MSSVTVVIPAYNEEKTIGEVISVVKKVDLVDYIIVVSDGSCDSTAEIAKSFNVDVVELAENLGKGGALKRGVDKSSSDTIIFLDADLVGLRPEHIKSLLIPVLREEVDMTIGIFDNGRSITDLAQRVTPYLSGQRAVKKYIIDNILDFDSCRYGVEVAITKYALNNNIRTKEVVLDNLTHIMKEEKLGVVKGFAQRLKMYWDIAKIISKRRCS